MIRNILLTLVLALGFSNTAFAAHHEDDGVKKAEKKAETPTPKDQKAEADAALKKVEAMTKKARGNDKEKDKKDKKKK